MTLTTYINARLIDLKSEALTEPTTVTTKGDTIVSVDYQTIVPLVGNVSALLDFSISTDAAANLADE